MRTAQASTGPTIVIVGEDARCCRLRRAHDAALQVPAKIDAHARRNGLILRFIGNRVAFSPPLIITEDEIIEMRDKLLAALDATLTEIRQ